MNRHPLSALFAQYDLAGEDLNILAEDIKANGLHLPITTHEGMILDGWNRFQACQIAKVRPVFLSLAPGLDPWEFVKGANMLRRHMSPAERVAVMLLKRRMDGEHSRMNECSDNHVVNNDQLNQSTKPSVREIQRDLEVSKGVAVKAAQVARADDPALEHALSEKRVSLNQAAELAKMPEPERKAALESPALKPPKPTPPAPESGDVAALKARIAELEAENEELKGHVQELIKFNDETKEELDAARRVLDAEDLLAGFDKEVKRNQELARVLQSRNNGLMVENHDLAGRLKSALRKVEKLEKHIKGVAGQGAGSEPETSTEEDEYNATFTEEAS